MISTEREDSVAWELHLARIRCLVMLNRIEEASEEVRTFGASNGAVSAELLVDALWDAGADLQKRHDPTSDAMIGLGRECLGEMAAPEAQYRVLMHAFYGGQYELVLDGEKAWSGETRGKDSFFRLCHLKHKRWPRHIGACMTNGSWRMGRRLPRTRRSSQDRRSLH